MTQVHDHATEPAHVHPAGHAGEGAVSCGPMSLWRLAGLMGQKKLSLEDVTKRFAKPEAACSAQELVAIGKDLGLELTVVRSSGEQLHTAVVTLNLPVTLHLHGNHWATIRQRAMGRIGIWHGKQEDITSLEKLHADWSGIMLVPVIGGSGRKQTP